MTNKSLFCLCAILTSCADATTPPQMNVPDVGAIIGWLASSGGGPVFTAEAAGTHERVVPCPLAGRMVQAWTSTIQTENDVDRIVWSGTIRNEACTLSVESSQITLDGNTQLEGESRIRRPAQPGQRSTLLYSRAHESGQITSEASGRRQTCILDLMRTFEPNENAIRIRGIYCNSVIDLQMPRLP